MSAPKDKTPQHPAPPKMVVGIGASAGGLKAFQALLQNLPEQCPLAIVLIQHLSPDHPSQLAEILSSSTALPVVRVDQPMLAESNRIFVIAHDQNLVFKEGYLRPIPRSPKINYPIDEFFKSLAGELGNNAVGVVLSGTGSDGALGLKEIKAHGGITFIQSRESASYPEMPLASLRNDCVDFVLPPEEIGKQLCQIGAFDPKHEAPATEERGILADAKIIVPIVQLLSQRFGNDFSKYKPGTLERRILRRMLLTQTGSPQQYLASLRSNPAELKALRDDLLIRVTRFFRDPEVFESLSNSLLPQLVKIFPP